MGEQAQTANREHIVTVNRGGPMLAINIVLFLGSIALLIYSLAGRADPIWFLLIASILILIGSIIMMPGFFTLQPGEARVLVLFGKYKGTVRASGFHWGNPFYSNQSPLDATPTAAGAVAAQKGGAESRRDKLTKTRSSSRFRVSLRVRNMNSDTLKVNDRRGNPVEIGAVIVWRVHDTAQAMFDVDNYEDYVRIQSESAIRHLASSYAYDDGEQNETTLRSGVDEVSAALQAELQERLNKAGVTVEEARLTHLAYAPEIAQAMLRRQQAEAVIAARKKIVHGAVSMVDMALTELADKSVIELDDERKASMISNLMVVLCGESEVHPVVNTGTLYT